MECGLSGYNIMQMVHSKLNHPKEDTVDTKMLEKKSAQNIFYFTKFLNKLITRQWKNIFIDI